jgi:NitT/TauT family transport system substrate-binding protein
MRTARLIALVLVTALAVSLLAACSPAAQPPAQGSSAVTTATPKPVTPLKIRLGNLPTEDILPLWVAQQKGLIAGAGITLEIVPFQSAQERDAAFTAGAIDGFMGDIVAVGELQNAGFKNRIATVCLGATPAEGRFGIVSAPGSGVTSLKQLANVPVGTSSGTVQEYVLDGLMAEAGVPAAKVKKEEVKKVPERFQLLMNSQLKAAALPEPFLSLAVKQGAHLVAADTKGKNLSQTVLAFSDVFLAKAEGAEAVERLLEAWDKGAALVNASPNAYRALLVEKARLPKPVASSYKINAYPLHKLPTEAEVNAVLSWMGQKKLVKGALLPADILWVPGQTVTPTAPSAEPTTPATGNAPAGGNASVQGTPTSP